MQGEYEHVYKVAMGKYKYTPYKPKQVHPTT